MKRIIGAAIGSCVHVSGLYHFLKMSEDEGFQVTHLGPAVPVRHIAEVIRNEKPDIMALSYRLTPEVAGNLFVELSGYLNQKDKSHTCLIFGGTAPVAAVARETGLFSRVFDGTETTDEIRSFLQGVSCHSNKSEFAQDLLTRINRNYPYPVIRHHFGRPTMDETVKGIREIAQAGIIDVISIGPDQNAQEHFFSPAGMDPRQSGAGGVPVRTSDDMAALYDASRCGNYPLMRCYAGTRDLLKWADMSVRTIHNAWGAIPLCWYSVLDGRSDRGLREAIAENQKVMEWYANHHLPVEVNEAHQWSLRDAHDSLAVAMAFIAAYNAKKQGVRDYVVQMMFNTPPGTTPRMDLAKMSAKLEMISELEDDHFKVIREVRAGIAHFSPQASVAKGQLSASSLISLLMKPHILHVVGFSEGDHASSPEELIESCQIVHGVIRNALNGLPDVWTDNSILSRKGQLINEAKVLIDAFSFLGADFDDPLTEPYVITSAIREGILDTPHFRGNPMLRGEINTGLVDGGWEAMDPMTGKAIDEETRITRIFKRIKTQK